MPLEREQLTLAVLLLCVPLQYFAGRYMGNSEISRSFTISKMVSRSHEKRAQIKIVDWFSIWPRKIEVIPDFWDTCETVAGQPARGDRVQVVPGGAVEAVVRQDARQDHGGRVAHRGGGQRGVSGHRGIHSVAN